MAIGFDLTVYESGSGGDVILNTNDLDMTNSFYNQIYLAWFGGNIEDSHSDSEDKLDGEENYDYWQNSLFFSEDKNGKLVSETELALLTLPLTSQGLYNLETIAKEDLSFLSDFGNVEVNVEIDDYNRISLTAKIEESGETNSIDFKFVWDYSKQVVITEKIL